MSDYVEYIKGGDILLAPSIDYKHQYVVKCGLCDEYYGELDLFLSHYLYHLNEEEEDILGEQQLPDEFAVAGDNDNVLLKIEQITDTEEEDNSNGLKDESGDIQDDADLKEKAIQTPKESNLTSDVFKTQLGQEIVLELEANHPTTSFRDKTHMEFAKTFMKSKEKVTALIEAYKNEPHLWNFSLPVKYRKKEKRIQLWDKIATYLKEEKNIAITINQVAACLIYLRQKYRERKRNSDLVATNANDVLPAWAFRQLHFLNAYVESKPVALLDVHQDLSPKQTAHVLNIYQRCLHLWDTNTIEYHCSNKRNEAFIEMMNLIHKEMDLEVEEGALRTYLQGVRDYITKVKRRGLGIIKVDPEKVKCHDHLMFLYDHVGPFKCSFCRKTVFKPLALMAHESEHKDTVPFKCLVCGKEFKLVETYLFHIRRHMGDLRHKCSECDKKFLRQNDLKEHIRCHTGDKPFCCEICGASFRQRTGFGMHMKRHGKRYISFCPYCSKGFYSKDSMQMHSKVHTDERDFVCPTCGKAFKTRKTLKSHRAIHENGHHECSLCGKAFKNRINLWQHTRKHRLNSAAQIPTELMSPFDDN